MTWFKLYCRCVHVTKSWHCPCNSSISMRSYHNLNFIKDLTRKYAFFWKVALVQVQQLGTDTRYKLEILHQCGKRVKTKSQKVLGANSYICRSYRGKTGRGALGESWIGLKLNWQTFWKYQNLEIWFSENFDNSCQNGSEQQFYFFINFTHKKKNRETTRIHEKCLEKKIKPIL